MNRFVPRGKMSKKKRRALDSEKRALWAVPPATKVIPNKKKLEQQRKPRPGREDAGWGDFLYAGCIMGRLRRHVTIC